MTDRAEIRRIAEEALERSEKATEGPWVHAPGQVDDEGRLRTEPTVEGAKREFVAYTALHPNGPSDAEFIAHARIDVPTLAQVVLDLSTRLDEVEGELAEVWDDERHADAIEERISKQEAENARLKEELARAKSYEQAIDRVKSRYPTTVFPSDSDSVDAKSAAWARMVCDNIKLEAESIQEEE